MWMKIIALLPLLFGMDILLVKFTTEFSLLVSYIFI